MKEERGEGELANRRPAETTDNWLSDGQNQQQTVQASSYLQRTPTHRQTFWDFLSDCNTYAKHWTRNHQAHRTASRTASVQHKSPRQRHPDGNTSLSPPQHV